MEKEDEYIEGCLAFDGENGKFWIIDVEETRGLALLEFGSEFQVFSDGKWIDTGFKIGNASDGGMAFTLKNTDFGENIEGSRVRIKK